MSHTVIITSSVAAPNPAGVAEQNSSPIDVTVTYTPSHELTNAQVGNHVEKILNKIQQMAE